MDGEQEANQEEQRYVDQQQQQEILHQQQQNEEEPQKLFSFEADQKNQLNQDGQRQQLQT
jgi:alpha-tubulin suppressor-like RCC1 family protein